MIRENQRLLNLLLVLIDIIVISFALFLHGSYDLKQLYLV